MTEEQKEKNRRTREAKAAEAKERSRRRESIKAALEKIATSEDASIEQRLKAAELVAVLDGIRH